MFSKLKHRLDRKSKRVVALLATITLLCSFTGCAGNEVSSTASDSVSSALQSTPVAESKDSQDPEVNSDTTGSSVAQNERGSGQSEFDFNEAVKNITLFNSKFSLPCTIKDLGEDFSYANLEYITSISDQKIVCVDLAYQGQEIGSAFLADCDIDDVLEDKEIFILSLGFATDYGYPNTEIRKEYLEASNRYSEVIPLELGGLSFATPLEELMEKLDYAATIDERDYAGIMLRDVSYTPLSNDGARLKFSYAKDIAYETYIQVK